MESPVAKTDEVFGVLKQRALEMRTITCGELQIETGYNPRDRRQLEWISQHVCHEHGRPDLSAIVVKTDDPYEPAPGWVPGWLQLPSKQARVRYWRTEVLRVWSYDWSNVELTQGEAAPPSAGFEFPGEIPARVDGVLVDPDPCQLHLELTTKWVDDERSFTILIANNEAKRVANEIMQQIEHLETTQRG